MSLAMVRSGDVCCMLSWRADTAGMFKREGSRASVEAPRMETLVLELDPQDGSLCAAGEPSGALESFERCAN